MSELETKLVAFNISEFSALRLDVKTASSLYLRYAVTLLFLTVLYTA